MKSILMVTNNQFAYHTDSLKYCEYLGGRYKIEFVCPDNGLPKVVNKNIIVHYIENKNKFIKRIQFLKVLKKTVTKLKPDIICIDYFLGCSLIKLVLGNRYIYNVDIRSGAISKKKTIRILKNLILRLDCYVFSNISIISRGLQKNLKVNPEKVHIIPVGGDKNVSDKNIALGNGIIKNIKLVYVGTLYERNIEETIVGIKIFMNKYGNNNIEIHYDIIGFSKNLGHEEKIERYIQDLKLTHVVKFHGKLEYSTALKFIREANIGISYIPITEYFNFQPPTKTFEYLLSGIPCIATNTFENAQIINSTSGVLIKDTAEDFCEGLSNIINNFNNYKAEKILNSVNEYTWENIILNNVEPYLKKLCNAEKVENF